MIEEIKPEIVSLLGPKIQAEISKGFLNNVPIITELLERFTQLELNMQ